MGIGSSSKEDQKPQAPSAVAGGDTCECGRSECEKCNPPQGQSGGRRRRRKSRKKRRKSRKKRRKSKGKKRRRRKSKRRR